MTLKPSLAAEKSDADLFIENLKVGKLLTLTQAAQVLGLTPNALRIKVCRGKVRYWKLDGRIRFLPGDLSSLLQKGA